MRASGEPRHPTPTPHSICGGDHDISQWLGGAGFVKFGTPVVVGVKTLRTVDFDTSYRNFIIVGLSVAMAMIPNMKPEFLSFMPDWSQVIFKSPVTMGAITAISLNALLNGIQYHGGLKAKSEQAITVCDRTFAQWRR